MENEITASDPHGVDKQTVCSLFSKIENYLRKTYSWRMTREDIDRDFYSVLCDNNTDPAEIIEGLSQINCSYFINLLSSRGVFTQDKIQSIADQLEAICSTVLSDARAAREQKIVSNLRQRIETYLIVSPKEDFFSNNTLPTFRTLLEDKETDYDTLKQRLSCYSRREFEEVLMQRLNYRCDITYEELELIVDVLEATCDCILSEYATLSEMDQLSSVQAEERPTTEQNQPSATTYTWTTWEQLKLKPIETASPSTLSWTTWEQLEAQQRSRQSPDE